jgi:hypothetical protein
MSHGFQVVTLVIAVLGLALSVAALTWQAVTFVLSGSRAKVELLHGAHDGMSGVITGPPVANALQQAVQQGYVHEVIGAAVRNVGRMPVTVERMQAVLANGIKIHWQEQLGPPMPFRLEAHSSERWYMPMLPVRQAIQTSHQAWGQANAQDVHVEVDLGTGKTVKSRERLNVQG